MSLSAVVFLALFAGGCFLAFSRHPIYGLAAYILVFYLHPPSRWWGQALPEFGWSMLAACVTLAAVIARKDKPAIGPILRHKVMVGLVLFIVWVGVQTLWAMDLELQLELLALFVKYALLVVLIYLCIDSEQNLRLILWTHVVGCFYLGWLAFTSYEGGRFETFGGPGIDDANTGGLQIVTGMLAAGSLLLAGSVRARLALVAMMPFIVNALVTTISRSAFLAATLGGIIFNLFSPVTSRRLVRVLSLLGIILFVGLTGNTYWDRIQSIKQVGEDVEGVDTGQSRIVVLEMQWRIFQEHPLGCGHRCTALLSPQYLEDKWLAGPQGNRARSSHNTFMTMLTEQGVPGAMLYLAAVAWLARSLFVLGRGFRHKEGFLPILFPAVASIILGIIVGDLFVDYLKLEVRIWFLAILAVMQRMSAAQPSPVRQPVKAAASHARR